MPFEERVNLLMKESRSMGLGSGVHPAIFRAQCVLTVRNDEIGAPPCTDASLIERLSVALARGLCIVSIQLPSSNGGQPAYGTVILQKVTGTLPPPQKDS